MSEDTRSAGNPAFRNVDLRPGVQDGRHGIVIRDPFGIAAEVFVPQGLLPVVGRFDGSQSIAEIEAVVRGTDGAPLPAGLVAGLVQQMDDLLLLDTPHFRRALGSAADAFLAAGVRPPACAGTAGYPRAPAPLREALESMVRRAEPGVGAGRDGAPVLRGLVAPHIDLARGREGYAIAYSALAEAPPADLYVVFGTGHQGPGAIVTGLPIDWETPLGRVTTDRDFVRAVHDQIGPARRSDLLLHRDEHSLEFQMLFLQHVLAATDQPLRVAGFLTGKLDDPDGGRHRARIEELLAAFRAASGGRRVCFLAGADLAHIGPTFGDADAVDADRLERLGREERARLSLLERGDPAGFVAAIARQDNPDRVCGTTPIFLAASLAGGPGRLLHYGQAPASDGSQTVSFCALSFP